MNKNALKPKYLLVAAAVCLVGIVALGYYFFLTDFSDTKETQYVYVDDDDTIDSVLTKLRPVATEHGLTGFGTLIRHTEYGKQPRTGRFAIEPGESTWHFMRKMKNGQQQAVKLTIPESRTMERMVREHKAFWDSNRLMKAEAAGLSPDEVCTLASIIDEETANNGEKPMIAGMYLNRLHKDMPLQADPTVKFALKNFALKRIYHDMLFFDSPYNTYRNTGLPPGPIKIASIKGIDAVLNYVQHDYLYMCAKEDFSGTHNFAATYQEHLKNAARYTKALNERGIK